MMDPSLYTNLLYRAGVVTKDQANEIARLIAKIDEHERLRNEALDNDEGIWGFGGQG